MWIEVLPAPSSEVATGPCTDARKDDGEPPAPPAPAPALPLPELPELLPACARVRLATGTPWAAASTDAGVPARLAQSLPRGPDGSHTSSPIGSAAVAPSAPSRTPSRAGQPAITRAATATSTATTQIAVTISIHLALASLPVPSPWITATGQEA